MSVLVDIDHEGGDLSEYTATVTDGGDLSVTAAAALANTGYGLQCVIDDVTAIYGTKTLAAGDTSGTVRFRFYIDPNSLVMAEADAFNLVNMFNSTAVRLAYLYLTYTAAGGYQLRVSAVNDAFGNSLSSFAPITDAPHYVEVKITRASTAVSADGSLTFWADGTQISTRANIDNFDVFLDFYRIQFGAASAIDAGTSGTLYLDELVINNDGTQIGDIHGMAVIHGLPRSFVLHGHERSMVLDGLPRDFTLKGRRRQ